MFKYVCKVKKRDLKARQNKTDDQDIQRKLRYKNCAANKLRASVLQC